MRKFILGSLGTITLLSCIFFVMTGASNRPLYLTEDEPSIYGIVKDKETGVILRDVLVYAVTDGYEQIHTYTNAYGEYRFEDDIPLGTYTVVAKIEPPPNPERGNWYGAIESKVDYSCFDPPCSKRVDLYCTYFENSPE